MGTTLTGKNISASYLGLLKSTDNLAISTSAKTITDGTSEAEVFNIIGQLRSLERIKASGELENKTEKKEQITNDLGAKPKV